MYHSIKLDHSIHIINEVKLSVITNKILSWVPGQYLPMRLITVDHIKSAYDNKLIFHRVLILLIDLSSDPNIWLQTDLCDKNEILVRPSTLRRSRLTTEHIKSSCARRIKHSSNKNIFC